MRYFVVDTENVDDYSFLRDMNVSENDTLVLLVSEKSKKIDLRVLSSIKTSGVEIICEEVKAGSLNALDLQLSVWLTWNLSMAVDSDEFIIVSNNSDYEILAQYLAKKTKCEISVIKAKTLVDAKVDVESEQCIKEFNIGATGGFL